MYLIFFPVQLGKLDLSLRSHFEASKQASLVGGMHSGSRREA